MNIKGLSLEGERGWGRWGVGWGVGGPNMNNISHSEEVAQKVSTL